MPKRGKIRSGLQQPSTSLGQSYLLCSVRVDVNPGVYRKTTRKGTLMTCSCRNRKRLRQINFKKFAAISANSACLLPDADSHSAVD